MTKALLPFGYWGFVILATSGGAWAGFSFADSRVAWVNPRAFDGAGQLGLLAGVCVVLMVGLHCTATPSALDRGALLRCARAASATAVAAVPMGLFGFWQPAGVDFLRAAAYSAAGSALVVLPAGFASLLVAAVLFRMVPTPRPPEAPEATEPDEYTDLPGDREHILSALGLATGNRIALQEARQAACYYCCQVFPAANVTDWLDEDTGLCPWCMSDSVIPYAEWLTPRLLRRTNAYWF